MPRRARGRSHPHAPTSSPDIARTLNLYEPLLFRDRDYRLEMLVAKSVTASPDAKTWTAVLRDGIKFHDGRPVTPADVVATFRRITDPKDPKNGAASLGMLAEVVPVGENAVEFRLAEPSATFDDYLGQYPLGIVPADFDVKKPIGTGPFRVSTFTPGLQSEFVRNEHYWRPGEPYLDKLVLIDFAEYDAVYRAHFTEPFPARTTVAVGGPARPPANTHEPAARRSAWISARSASMRASRSGDGRSPVLGW